MWVFALASTMLLCSYLGNLSGYFFFAGNPDPAERLYEALIIVPHLISSLILALWAYQCRAAEHHDFMKATEVARLVTVGTVAVFLLPFVRYIDQTAGQVVAELAQSNVITVVGTATVLATVGPAWSSTVEIKHKIQKSQVIPTE